MDPVALANRASPAAAARSDAGPVRRFHLPRGLGRDLGDPALVWRPRESMAGNPRIFVDSIRSRFNKAQQLRR